jgi:hypothetical protein
LILKNERRNPVTFGHFASLPAHSSKRHRPFIPVPAGGNG